MSLEAVSPVVTGQGELIGRLTLSVLPGRRADRLSETGGLPHVVEGETYRYSLILVDSGTAVELDPGPELFSFDTSTQLSGRFQPRQHVGRLRIRVAVRPTGVVGMTEIEVRPTKLEYASEYQQMLRDVAVVSTDALLQGFSPAALALRHEPERRSEMLYQQFALVHARLSSREVQDALALVVANPHRAWFAEAELQRAGRPLPGSSNLPRAVARPGSRISTQGRLRVASVPRVIDRVRTDATYDSPPNRFVKYALGRWRFLAQRVVDSLAIEAQTQSGPIRRGHRAATEVLLQIDRILANPFFREVGSLTIFPSTNQVLHKQEGYRQVFELFVLAEVGAALSLDWDIDDAFAATQRNIATLYEYWAFMQLVEATGVVCGRSRAVEALTPTDNGMSLRFREGDKSCVSWDIDVDGRSLTVEIYFNKRFPGGSKSNFATSWTRTMRPDCSLRVRPKSLLPEVEPGALDIWLHFDAKYRVEWHEEEFVDAAEDNDLVFAGEAARRGHSKGEDLLKMHAYRDAIQSSAGAYVLFPGTLNASPFREFQELLPGLGAFVLRPSETGPAVGAATLQDFLREVLRHVANRASQHERDRYWHSLIRRETTESDPSRRPFPSLGAPPQDELVLCVTLAREAHDELRRTRTFVLPRTVDLDLASTQLCAEWLLIMTQARQTELWRRDSAWLLSARDRVASARGRPIGGYLTARVRPVDDAPRWIGELGQQSLSPTWNESGDSTRVLTWADVLAA